MLRVLFIIVKIKLDFLQTLSPRYFDLMPWPVVGFELCFLPFH